MMKDVIQNKAASTSLMFNLAIFLLFSGFVPNVACADSGQCTYRYSRAVSRINNHAVTVEYYIPDGHKSRGLVFMLHGSAGAFTNLHQGEPAQDNFGEKTIARSCFAVVFPHYLEAIGVKSLTSNDDAASLFPKLLETCGLLLTSVESSSWNKNKLVFLFGESLGGYLSVALAMQRPEVQAVSEISGGLAPGYSVERPHSFSLLISHGVDDNIVSAQEAEDLESYSRAHGIRVKKKLYAGTGHYFSQADEMDCILRTINLFRNGIQG